MIADERIVCRSAVRVKLTIAGMSLNRGHTVMLYVCAWRTTDRMEDNVYCTTMMVIFYHCLFIARKSAEYVVSSQTNIQNHSFISEHILLKNHVEVITSMEGTIYSLIPAIIMLILVITTRRVLLSLGTGIVVGALFIHDFHIDETIGEIWTVFYEIFILDGALNTGNIYLLVFLLLLGMMTAFLQASGGSQAFGKWMVHKIKTRKGAQWMTGALGIIIFIDDYFSSLAVGQISRPLTDRHRISRAKLAYYIDSSAAPITVLSPISSWGAYIIGILGSIFVANGITGLEPLGAFIQMIPMNFYAIGALLIVFLVILFQLDIGPMRKHEKRAMETGELFHSEKEVPGNLSNTVQAHGDGRVYHLIVPMVVLVATTVGSMLVTGAIASEGAVDIFTIFANTNVNLSLFIGGLAAVVSSLIFHFSQSRPRTSVWKIASEGSKSMLPAIYILILAWMIGSVISTLETGTFLAEVVENAQISASLLPFIFFIISALMAVATGSSWGTFGIMLPIAGQVAAVADPEMLLPTLAAVLAGSVFGDHCTPISDTTILSSTGAGSVHIDHVITQMPYAIIAAVSASIGYLVMGLINQLWLALIITIIVIALLLLSIYFWQRKGKAKD